MVKTSADRFQTGAQSEALGFERKNKELLNLLTMEQLTEWNKPRGTYTFLIKPGILYFYQTVLIARAGLITWQISLETLMAQ